jgi:NCAIR mutase (PurE)-related protein
MDENAIRQLLDDVRSGSLDPDDAVARLRRLPFADIGFARVDHHRPLRQGLLEAVYAPGKTPEQCAAIVAELLAEPAGQPVLLTRADPDQAAAAMDRNPGWLRTPTSPAAEQGARGAIQDLSLVSWRPASERPGRVFVVTAGTADLPVAEECNATLVALGLRPELLTDCGVAGIHRLLVSAEDLADADAVVVVAGMEGALASLVAGVTPAPVVAVPTSTGYGAAFDGIAALLAMLSSCAAGVTVVGIDNGFGAACALSRLLG